MASSRLAVTTTSRRVDVARWLPALAPLAVAVGYLVVGRPLRAQIVFAFAALMGLVILAGVPVARWIEVAVVKVIRVVADVLVGGAFLVVAVPAWCWRTLMRRTPLDGARGWRVSTAGGGDPVSLGGHATASGATISTRLLAAVGLVVVLLAADYGIGWTWDQAFPTDQTVTATLPGAAGSPSDAGTGGATTTTLPPDPRTGVAAMASSPWAAAYFEDLRGQEFGYWPFTADRPEDYASRYINVEDWVRRSWESPDAGDGPTVWMLGGSAMFGEGQRDEHTIPSEIARLAEAAGLPIVVRNYGQRGWVHMQEALLFEQELALKPAPDLAVFYDGPNDLQAAAMFRDAIPTDLHADQYAQILRDKHIASNLLTQPKADVPLNLLGEYAEHSALRKVVRWFKSEPAGASPAETAAPATPAAPVQEGSSGDDSIRNEDGNVQWGSIEDGEQGMEIYGRARAISRFVGDEAGVDSVYFWQPMNADDPAVGYAREHLPAGVIDLSDALGDQADDVYIDTVHTNEAGARLVAEAMWAELKPQVEAWYEANR